MTGHGHTNSMPQEVPVGAPGCRLPDALGVFAQHSAESSDDPVRAAMGRCQTPAALEHPLATNQPWPHPWHSSRQWPCHTCCWVQGSWLWDFECMRLALLLPAWPFPPAPSPLVHPIFGRPKGPHRSGELCLSHGSQSHQRSSFSLCRLDWGQWAEADKDRVCSWQAQQGTAGADVP